MARLYEQLIYVPDHTGGEYAMVPFPSRSYLSRCIIAGPNSFNATLFNRSIAPAAFNIHQIVSAADGTTIIRPTVAQLKYVRVGDPVVVAGSSEAGYDTTHRVTWISDDGTQIQTDQTYTAVGTGGTATVTLAAAHLKLFELVAITAASSGVATLDCDPNVPFVNQDTEHASKKWIDGALYFLLSASGDYWIALAGSTDEV